MTDLQTFIAPGELRADLLSLFSTHPRALHVLLSAPGYFGLPFDGNSALFERPDMRISQHTAFSYRAAILENFRSQIDQLPQSAAWEQIIRRWIELLQTKKARFFHREDLTLFTRLISHPQSSLVFTGPITEQRFQQQSELNFQLAGQQHERARQWFTEHIEASRDISKDVQTALLESWAGPFIDPEDLYYKVLTEYFWQTIQAFDVETDNNPMLAHLTGFQIDAYQHAKGILRQFGGVFLADVVGLGKTYIGLALLKFLQMRYQEHAVIVAPPNVCPQWEALAKEYRIELGTVSHGKLSDLQHYNDREIVLIDESHNFRNQGTARYDDITRWLERDGAKNTKVILLSATPQNNRPEDVASQLAFFPDHYARLPFPENSLDAWIKQIRAKKASMSDLLQHVVVRRTRHFIKSEYPDAIIRVRDSEGKYQEVPLTFPRRVSDESQCLRYSIDNAYGEKMYDQILQVIEAMHYAIYGLADYILPAHKTEPKLAGISRAGRGLRGLFKVLMLKRLESSVEAFRMSLENFKNKLQDALRNLQNHRVQIRTRHYEETDDDLSAYTEGNSLVTASWFDTRLLTSHLAEDLRRVQELREMVEKIQPAQDAKLARLKSYLAARPPTEHRTLVFTQFSDTAKYLTRELGQAFGQTALATGETNNLVKLTQRFAPRASRMEGQIAESDQIHLLISTDVLSEGVNLQDANTLINYDLHWNPVRLIQRAGRIDRIGSINDEIYIASFLPEKGLEKNLGLEAVLRKRIEDFRRVFGEDSSVLPAEGQALLEDDAIDLMYSAYSGEALRKAEQQAANDNLDGLSRHSERLLKLRRDEPERYNRILNLRPGRRACSKALEPPIVATKMDWYWAFWTPDIYDEPHKLSNHEGLDHLYQHTLAGAADLNNNLERDRISNDLSAFVIAASRHFELDAELVRDQRLHPVLTRTDNFLLDSLETYKKQCLESEKPLLERLREWVRAATAQHHLRRLCRSWTSESHSPRVVFHELRALLERYPPPREESGIPLTIAAVISESG